MNFYKAKVVYYDDEENTEYCVTSAATYTDAMERIAKYYGDNSIEEIQLSWLYDNDVLPVSENMLSSLELY